MRNNLRFVWAGLAICLAGWLCQADTKPAATQPTTARAAQLVASQWSEPSKEGLQTRLIPVTRTARPGKPLFIRMELRHKDGEESGPAIGGLYYPAKVVVRDQQGKAVDSLSVDLKFNTSVPVGKVLSLGVFLAGRRSAALRAGRYAVTVEPRTTVEMLNRGGVRVSIAGPLAFIVPPTPSSAPTKAPLEPDYAQAEEIKAYLRAKPTRVGQLVGQGRSISGGLAALVEKGDSQISALGLSYWQYAAYLLGEIGDERAVPFLRRRLEGSAALGFHFVHPLGRLRVKQAVPRLVARLRSLRKEGWLMTSVLYGSKASYLGKALEEITGRKFLNYEHEPRLDRVATLQVINAWWESEGKRQYAAPATQPAAP